MKSLKQLINEEQTISVSNNIDVEIQEQNKCIVIIGKRGRIKITFDELKKLIMKLKQLKVV